jgi:copper chaperone CopZ
MTTKYFRTNLNCGSCVAAVTPFLNGSPSIKQWSVDTADPRKILAVEGTGVSRDSVERLVSDAGFKVFDEITSSSVPASSLHELHPASAATPQKSLLATYHPLLLILAYLVGIVALSEITAGSFHWMRAMGHFMGGFFVAFSFFKLLDLPGFATSYQTYDVLARRSIGYGYAYPFIELALGIAYLVNFSPVMTNVVTLAVMLVGLVGVTQALLAKRKIQCACLGSVFNLPMSYVTFIEDGVMALMALAMLATTQVHGV